VPVPPPDTSVRNSKTKTEPLSSTPKSGSTANPTTSASNAVPKKQEAGKIIGPPSDSEAQRLASFTAGTPLGLRYSVLKRTGPGRFVETDLNTTFRSGDGIRVSIESNDDAYLYIVNKGSSGTWSLLFPSADINGGNNRVQAHQRIEIPGQGQFTFVDEPGEERLFVVLSRPPAPDLEELITSLIFPDQPKNLSAQSIGDELVGRLSSFITARDLIFQRVQDELNANKEHSTYIVNVNGSDSSRVVADLSLRHR
jgi:hypothetical protein